MAQYKALICFKAPNQDVLEKDRELFLSTELWQEPLSIELPKLPASLQLCMAFVKNQNKKEQKQINIEWLDEPFLFNDYLKEISCSQIDLNSIINSFTFDLKAPLPAYVTSLNLIEEEKQVACTKLQPPFEELDHTADLAFKIFGKNLMQIQLHALWALAFEANELACYHKALMQKVPKSIEEVVFHLNGLIAEVDTAIGLPFKAVSLAGKIVEFDEMLSMWEMIVDV